MPGVLNLHSFATQNANLPDGLTTSGLYVVVFSVSGIPPTKSVWLAAQVDVTPDGIADQISYVIVTVKPITANPTTPEDWEYVDVVGPEFRPPVIGTNYQSSFGMACTTPGSEQSAFGLLITPEAGTPTITGAQLHAFVF